MFPIIADDTSKGTNTARAVFIIDPNGVIRAMLYYPQELGRNIDEILRMIKALQIFDRNRVTMPANWPNNELIGNKVIIPSAKDEETTKERIKKAKAKEIECFNWWLCYKGFKPGATDLNDY